MSSLSCLTDADLLHKTRLLLERSHQLDAELLLLLGEIDARRLYAERAFPSMFAFCTAELGFSEDVACNRIGVARLARRFPRVLDFVRSGRIHLSGLRLLEAHLTQDNLEEVLAAATGKSKRHIEELVARLAPQPPVPPSIRKLPERAPAVPGEPPPSLSLPEGFARTRRHARAQITLLCTAHNQHSADKLYGRAFMQDKRRAVRPGADSQALLL